MSIEDRDYWHKDRARRAGHLLHKPTSEQVVVHEEITRLARAASVRLSLNKRPTLWPAFVAGLAVGVFGTFFVVGLLKL